MSQIVIIGNSAAGLAAIRSIRSCDRRSSITLIAAERHPPYSRIMLTYLLAGKTTCGRMPLHGPDWDREMGIRTLSGRRAVAIDTRRGQVVTEDAGSGRRASLVPFDRLLIATGASPQRPDLPGIELPGVFCLRDLDDAIALTRYIKERRSARPVPEALFLGGGPVCLQTLAALAAQGCRTKLLVRSSAIFSQLADPHTAALAEKLLRTQGIRIIKGVEVRGIEARGGVRSSAPSLVVHTDRGQPLPADVILVGKGTEPNNGLARASGIAADTGILVDDTMATSEPGVFAAGDVAQARHCVTGLKVCYGTWTNACEQGRIAGLNMAGRDTQWTGGLNCNVTTLFGNTLGSIGLIDAAAATIPTPSAITVKQHHDRRRGTSRRLLFSDGRCLGAVLWNDCDDLGPLGWLIRQGRDCAGWEDRITRGEPVWPNVLGLDSARGLISVFRMGKMQ